MHLQSLKLKTMKFIPVLPSLFKVMALVTLFLQISFVVAQAKCKDDETPFKIEFYTDDYPEETTWDIVNKDGVIKCDGHSYVEKKFFYNETCCLITNDCYQFTLRDSWGDGISGGNHTLFFDGALIYEEDSFWLSDKSPKFGEGCPTSQPSLSSDPSATPSRTFQPTDSSIPTSPPTNTINLIGFDDEGRRVFPSEARQDAYLESQLSWAGNLYFKPPTCQKDTRKARHCEITQLSTKKVVPNPFGVDDINFGYKDEEEYILELMKGETHKTFAIAVGDLNNDGLEDIVLGHKKKELQLLINLGNKTFRSLDLRGTPYTNGIALADLDQNGYLDIVTSNFQLGNQVHMNRGDDNYDILDLPSDQNILTECVAVADFNNDGFLDILFGRYQYNSLKAPNQILLNDKIGGFEKGIDLEGGSMYTTSVALADIDGNGYVDIVVGNGKVTNSIANHDEMQVNQILYNMGNLNFEVLNLTGTSDLTTKDIIVADLDGDGLFDIIEGNGISGLEGQRNRLLLNTANRQFDAIDLSSGKSDTKTLAVGDIDGDGYLDIFEGNVNGRNQVLKNRGGNSFDHFTLPGGSEDTFGLAILNADKNGFIDLAIANFDVPNVLLFNKGSLEGQYLLSDLPGGNSYSTQTISITTKGKLIVGNRQDPNEILIPWEFPPNNVIELPGGNHVTMVMLVEDVNNDGLLDIIVGNSDAKNQLLLNIGNDNFNVTSLPVGESNSTMSVAFGDMDGDGYGDIIVGNDEGSMQILTNQKNGTFVDDLSYVLPIGNSSLYEIAVGDIDGDSFIDIAIAHHEKDRDEEKVSTRNVILFNEGNGSFHLLELEDSETSSASIALADINDDGYLDVIVGNAPGANQLYIYKENRTFDLIELEDTSTKSDTFSIATGDINNDGLLDIVFANRYDKNILLLNQGKTRFKIEKLPGGSAFSTGVQVTDVDFDGNIDIVFANRDEKNHLILKLSCPNDGAQIHSKSWCFRCPNYMGRPTVFNQEISMCRECVPDHLQIFGRSEFCSPEPCMLASRLLGEDKCSDCPHGTFFDSALTRVDTKSSTWNMTRCRPCPPGQFSDGSVPAIGKCIDCPSGTFQNETNQIKCRPCKAGYYNEQEGRVNCIKCPFRLTSTHESTICPFCGDGFYLTSNNTAVEFDVFYNPQTYCEECPANARCGQETMLQTIKVDKGFWRDSINTSQLYECNIIKGEPKNACYGSHSDTSFISGVQNTGIYCIPNHTGPLCEACVSQTQYYSKSDGKCFDCPSITAVLMRLGIIIHFIITLMVVTRSLRNLIQKFDYHSYKPGDYRVFNVVVEKVYFIFSLKYNLSAQAKLKIFVSFYQVVVTLQTVYGVDFNDDFLEKLFTFFRFLSMDWFYFFLGIPEACLGSMRTRLVIGAIWPYMLILVVAFSTPVFLLMQKNKGMSLDGIFGLFGAVMTFVRRLWTQVLTYTIVIIYFVLTPVSRSIFDAIKCQAYKTNDAENDSTSYLSADLSVKCDLENEEYGTVKKTFWVLFAIWPLLTPFLFVILLMSIRETVRLKRTTPLAMSCSFLWREYNESMMFWDAIDVMRKLFFTGFINFIDIEEGTNKVFRLIIATITCGLYLCVLALAQPYKRASDLYLAIAGNLTLLCFFASGVMVQLCEDNITCENYVHNSFDSDSASKNVLILTLGMLVITIAFILVAIFNKVTAPTLMLRSSGARPILEMPKHCTFHAFVSHRWDTGQLQTHAIVRKFQNVLPGARFWLDVDELDDVSKLENAVGDSGVFILCYSEDYFKSANCVREAFAAMRENKPLIVIYEGKTEEVVSNMKEECQLYCSQGVGQGELEDIFKYLFVRNKPFRWFNNNPYSAAALKLISQELLSHLPYYKQSPHRSNELKSIFVPGELEAVEVDFYLEILFCETNSGAKEIAEEVRDCLGETNREHVNIADAKEFFSKYDTSEENLEKKLLPQKVVFLLYLNDNTFQENEEGHLVKNLLLRSFDKNIRIITAQEQDPSKGGRSFEFILKMTPDILKLPPYELYNDITVPLHETNYFRLISLRSILTKIGATPKSNSFRHFVQDTVENTVVTTRRISQSIRFSPPRKSSVGGSFVSSFPTPIRFSPSRRSSVGGSFVSSFPTPRTSRSPFAATTSRRFRSTGNVPFSLDSSASHSSICSNQFAGGDLFLLHEEDDDNSDVGERGG